ncbi:hypothetical protein [Sphingomonas faeni]|nr:hypothetical protein [Sphingomonas faeni]
MAVFDTGLWMGEADAGHAAGANTRARLSLAAIEIDECILVIPV